MKSLRIFSFCYLGFDIGLLGSFTSDESVKILLTDGTKIECSGAVVTSSNNIKCQIPPLTSSISTGNFIEVTVCGITTGSNYYFRYEGNVTVIWALL